MISKKKKAMNSYVLSKYDKDNKRRRRRRNSRRKRRSAEARKKKIKQNVCT